jgi:glycine dehydrogenase subunit 2
VLNANYVRARLRKHYRVAYDRTCMHEVVLDGTPFKEYGVRTLDIAKRLLDYGYHPPTIYLPLIVHESIMIEPTECETKDTLDGFIDAMLKIKAEAETNPKLLTDAPHTMPVKRLDEVRAAKQPIVCCNLNMPPAD